MVAVKLDGNHRYLLVLLGLYAALVAFGAIHYEMWQDVVDSWMAVRDMGLKELISSYIPSAGHPSFWYLLLVPLVKSGAPMAAMHVLHGAIAVAMAGVFLRFAPFPLLTRVLWIFSAAMLYHYAVIPRNYSLTMLCLFSVAALYPKRMERPWAYAAMVFLLFQTHALMFGLGVTLGACYLLELWLQRKTTTRGQVAAWLLMVAGGVLILWQLMPASTGDHHGAFFSKLGISGPAKGFFIPVSNGWLPFMYEYPGISEFMLSVSQLFPVAVMLLVVLAIGSRTIPCALFLMPFLWIWYVFSFKIGSVFHHHAVIPALTLFALWIARYHAPDKPEQRDNPVIWKMMWGSIHACLAYSCVIAGFLLCREFLYPYSAMPDTARFIQAHHLEDRTVIAYKGYGMAAYLPRGKFWSANTGQYQSYIRWDNEYYAGETQSLEDSMMRAAQEFGDLSGKLVLLNRPMPQALREHYGLALVYGELGQLQLEDAWLYMPAGEIGKLQ